MSGTIHNEKELLIAVSAGDKEAFSVLFYAYEKHIFSAALNITRSEELSEEIVQDTFLAIWLKKEKMVEVNDFKSYLFITARNFSIQMLRRIAYDRKMKQHFSDTTVPFLDPATDDPLLVQRYQQLEAEALRSLPPRQKQAYQLVKIEMLKRAEAAAIMEVDENTVKAHLNKAIRAVRAYCLTRMDVPLCLLLAGKKISDFF